MEDQAVRLLGGFMGRAFYQSEVRFAHDMIEGLEALCDDSAQFQAEKLDDMERDGKKHYSDDDVACFQAKMRRSRMARKLVMKMADELRKQYPSPAEGPE